MPLSSTCIKVRLQICIVEAQLGASRGFDDLRMPADLRERRPRDGAGPTKLAKKPEENTAVKSPLRPMR